MKIKLTETGYTLIPEGVTIFKITKVDDSKYEDFGVLNISMQTAEGKTHFERFSLIKNNGELNTGALKAFSYFAKTCLNNFKVEEIDPQDIVGCYIQATVKHEHYDYTNSQGEHKAGTSERLNDYAPASGFNGAEESEEPIDLQF